MFQLHSRLKLENSRILIEFRLIFLHYRGKNCSGPHNPEEREKFEEHSPFLLEYLSVYMKHNC